MSIGAVPEFLLGRVLNEFIFLLCFTPQHRGGGPGCIKQGQHGLRASPDQRYWSRAPVIVGSNPTRPTMEANPPGSSGFELDSKDHCEHVHDSRRVWRVPQVSGV